MKHVFLMICLMLALSIQVQAAEDNREAVSRTPAEKAFILGEMRKFLEALQSINDSLSRHDLASVSEAAEARGRTRNSPPPGMLPSLKAKETDTWRQWAQNVRIGFDTIAASAKSGEPIERQLALTRDILQSCTACHATYRIELEP